MPQQRIKELPQRWECSHGTKRSLIVVDEEDRRDGRIHDMHKANCQKEQLNDENENINTIMTDSLHLA